MKSTAVSACWVMLVGLAPCCGRGQSAVPARDVVQSRLTQECPSLFELYKHRHLHPELSFQETRTATRLTEELRSTPQSGPPLPDPSIRTGVTTFVACVLDLLGNPGK
jgi:hypothetical protein